MHGWPWGSKLYRCWVVWTSISSDPASAQKKIRTLEDEIFRRVSEGKGYLDRNEAIRK